MLKKKMSHNLLSEDTEILNHYFTSKEFAFLPDQLAVLIDKPLRIVPPVT